jgi:FKBP-type peptidyl-prolyl cis-trans isomerase SlyD
MSSELTVGKDRVVLFHYTMRDDAGEVLETTEGGSPQAILYGHGNVLKGLEQALGGLSAGDETKVTLAPAEAFGERREDWTQRLSKKYFPPRLRLRPGTVVRLQTDHGPRTVTVLKVGHKMVDVDLNSPFAGQTLHFDLAVVDVREPEPEELAHGHVHGPGGHQH